MAIEPGQMLSHYRLAAKIGAGGMGEVWKATDTTLDREVAIKILPESLSTDSDRLARFSREAKLLASLNHPHIAAVYGSHEADGVRFLAMELVDGEDLSERITRGRLPLDDVISIARQLGEALEAAHETGVIHRDLKPANIRLDSRGKVKVLDFGLAKALLPEAASGDARSSFSPTMTSAGSIAGVILGTAAYMSPEQARGKPVGRTADIWAYGCILYEMLAGRSVYGGETVTDVIAAVVTREPDWSVLPPDLPPSLRRLLYRCLEKNPEERLQHIGDARLELRDATNSPADPLGGSEAATAAGAAAGTATSAASATASASASTSRSPIILVIVAIVAVALGFLAARLLAPPPESAPAANEPVTRLELTLPHTLDQSGMARRLLALSHDGRRLVYAAQMAGRRELFIREMDGREPRPIPGTEGGFTPFFSPDGRNLAFFAGGKLKQVSLAGGAPLDLAQVPGSFFGGSWSEDGTIVYITSQSRNPQLIAAGGGKPRELVVPRDDDTAGALLWPEFLPGGTAFLATLSVGPDLAPENSICVVEMETGKLHILQRGSGPRYMSAGYIVYVQGDVLLAAPFDSEALRITGPSIALKSIDPLDTNSIAVYGAVSGLALARQGTLAFATQTRNVNAALVWVDRQGRVESAAEERRSFANPSISPDGRRIVISILATSGATGDIWTYDPGRKSLTRLTTDERAGYGKWSPDGRKLYYLSARRGRFGAYSRQTHAGGDAEEVIQGEHARLVMSFNRTGDTALFYEVNPETQRDIWSWKLDEEPRPLVVTPHDERAPIFSPDGNFFAYVSNEANRDDVYVRRFPDDGSRWLISVDGGTEPRFSPDGRELFYREGKRMMVVAIPKENPFPAGRPRELFHGEFMIDTLGNPNYDISPDGQRFLMIQGEHTATTRLEIILNWHTEMARLFAAGR